MGLAIAAKMALGTTDKFLVRDFEDKLRVSQLFAIVTLSDKFSCRLDELLARTRREFAQHQKQVRLGYCSTPGLL